MPSKVLIFLFIFTILLEADVKSTRGNIDFKINENSTSSMILNSTGLGIGSTQPSSNLHVAGNAIFSQLSVGSSTGSSNLHLSGTLSMSYSTISSNSTLGDTSVILVDASSDNVRIDLPYAGNVTGRVYEIKKINANNEVFIYAINSTIDGTEPLIMNSSSTLPSLKVISHDDNWHILSSTETDTILATDNLIGYWPLDESSGSTAYDLGPFGLHGNFSGIDSGNIGITGKVGNAVSFDGVDDQVNIPHNSAINLNSDWSIAFWYKQLSFTNTYPGPFRKGNSGSADGYIQFYAADGLIRYKRNNDQAFNQTAIYSTNTWKHIVYTYDDSSNTISLYVDGQFNTSSVIDYGTNNSTDELWLGRGDEHGNGVLDDFRIYNKILSSREIELLYDIE